MQAIRTVGVSPTDRHGARIKATASAGSCTCPWDHELSIEENHLACAMVLIVKLKWEDRTWYMGSLPDGSYCHVQTFRR